MSTFTWVPDQPAAAAFEPKVNTSQFGDGYSQRVPEGINNIAPVYNYNFTVRTWLEIKAIDNFLRAQKGAYAFYFTPPGEYALQKVICKKWSTNYLHDGNAELSCEFTWVPEP